MTINWSYPEPGKGLAGTWDRFVGPGATFAENFIMLFFAVLAGVAVVAYGIFADLGWSTVQFVVAALIAMDLVGGVITNATSTAKRWYHRPGQGLKEHLFFVAGHVHPFVVAWLFLSSDWMYGIIVYGYLILASIVTIKTPLYFQRPTAMIFYMGAILINLYVLRPIPGLEWFVPIFLLKLLLCHVLKEEPYRPKWENRFIQ